MAGRVWVACLLLACACKDPPPSPPARSDAGVPTASASASASASPERGLFGAPPDRPIEPVYPSTDGPPDPLAEKLCLALHRLPAERRAKCCNDTMGFEASELCTKTLTSAIRGKALSLDANTVEACTAALAKIYDGCDWVGPNTPDVPAICAPVTRGTLEAQKPCRSSLECTGDLRCHGVSPTTPGMCGPAKDNGASCNTAVDPLASHLGHDLDQSHAECAGACVRRRCVAPPPLGASCDNSPQCGKGKHCAAGRCAAGSRAASGKPCIPGACEPGTRCIDGSCAPPKAPGSSCKYDFECVGGCVKGKCAMDCARR
jgi:hypothetical protein